MAADNGSVRDKLQPWEAVMFCPRPAVLISVAFISSSLLGSPVPPIAKMPPAVRPVHALTPFPHLVAVVDPGGPLTLARLETMHVSGPIYNALLRLIAPVVPTSLAIPALTPDNGSDSTAESTSSRELRPTPLLTASPEVNARHSKAPWLCRMTTYKLPRSQSTRTPAQFTQCG